MDFATGFAAGLAFGKKKFGGGGGETENDPDYKKWLAMTEPNDNQAVFWVRVHNTRDMKVDFISVTIEGYQWDVDGYIIDWGDGTSSDFIPIYIDANHTYDEIGDYVITFTGVNSAVDMYVLFCSTYCKQYTSDEPRLLGVKYGAKVFPDHPYNINVGKLSGQGWLKYISLKNNQVRSQMFAYCYALRKIHWDIKFTNITDRCFLDCKSLDFSNLDFTQVTEIEEYGFCNCYNLKSLNMPSCESIGDNAMYGCCAFDSIKTADNCTFGSNCFWGCYGTL